MPSIVPRMRRSRVRSRTHGRVRHTVAPPGWLVIRCRFLAKCILLCRQPLRKLVDSIPPPPNYLGECGDRECCAPRHETGGVRHAPINNAARPAPVFFPGALDWRHRHQSPALVIDHLGDFRRRVVIPDVASSRERLRGSADPIRDAPVIFRRDTASGHGSSSRSNRLLSMARRARRLL
jgi:hypothetical protein